jgi:hypothetical protein
LNAAADKMRSLQEFQREISPRLAALPPSTMTYLLTTPDAFVMYHCTYMMVGNCRIEQVELDMKDTRRILDEKEDKANFVIRMRTIHEVHIIITTTII